MTTEIEIKAKMLNLNWTVY